MTMCRLCARPLSLTDALPMFDGHPGQAHFECIARVSAERAIVRLRVQHVEKRGPWTKEKRT